MPMGCKIMASMDDGVFGVMGGRGVKPGSCSPLWNDAISQLGGGVDVGEAFG